MNNTIHTQEDHIKSAVLEKIRSSEVHMKSRMHFTLRVLVVVLLAIVSLIFSSILISFILFSMRMTGRMFLFGFGGRGIGIFFLLFPWKILAIDIVLLLLLERLVTHFRFGYRWPVAYLFFVIFVFASLIGLLIDQTSFHHMLLRQADHKKLPFVGDAYEHVRRPPVEQGVVVGVVESVSTSTFSLETFIDSSTSTMKWIVVLPPDFALTHIQKGEHLIVAGDVVGNQIRAYGIKEVIQEDEIEE